ncbi:MAG: hypothetical protein WBG61_09935 [Desulfobacterales bacterium]
MSIDLFSDHIPVVLNVVRKLVCLDRFKSGLLEVLPRFFFTPHGTQSLSPPCDRETEAIRDVLHILSFQQLKKQNAAIIGM